MTLRLQTGVRAMSAVQARYIAAIVMRNAPIQDKVSEWTLAIWVIVVIAAVVVNYLRGH